MKTVPTVKIKRTDLSYIIINESDFNPNIHTLWTEEDEARTKKIKDFEKEKAKQVQKIISKEIKDQFGVSIDDDSQVDGSEEIAKDDVAKVEESDGIPPMPRIFDSKQTIFTYASEFYPEANVTSDMKRSEMLAAIKAAELDRKKKSENKTESAE